jgi:hypothetical protein
MSVSLSPSEIYFSHSRLDTKFSGCGKDIGTTLAEILSGQTRIEQIPLITVLGVDGRYISLNNRRLYLFKELLRLGRLPGGQLQCRLQKPTPKELKKYTGATLALAAKLNKCGPPKAAGERPRKSPAKAAPAAAGGSAAPSSGAACQAEEESKAAEPEREEEEEEEEEEEGEEA